MGVHRSHAFEDRFRKERERNVKWLAEQAVEPAENEAEEWLVVDGSVFVFRCCPRMMRAGMPGKSFTERGLH